MIYSNNIFETLSSMIGRKRQTAIFLKKTPQGKMGNLDERYIS